MGAFLVTDDHVFNGPLGCSLRSFARSAHSARSIHGLAQSLRSLPHGMVEIHEYVFTLKTRLTGIIAFVVSIDMPWVFP